MAAQYMHLAVLYPSAALEAAPDEPEYEPDWFPPAVTPFIPLAEGPPAAAPDEGPPAAAPAADADSTWRSFITAALADAPSEANLTLAHLHRTRVLVAQSLRSVTIIDRMTPGFGLHVVIESLSQALGNIDRMITDAEFDYIISD